MPSPLQSFKYCLERVIKMHVALALMTICLITGFAIGFKLGLFQRLQEDDRSVLNEIMASENRIVAPWRR